METNATTANGSELGNLDTADYVLTSLLLAGTTILNAVVLWILWVDWIQKKRRSNAPKSLLAILAVLDWLAGPLAHALRLGSSVSSSGWIRRPEVCSTVLFSTHFLTSCADSVVIVMAIERYLGIEKPYFYRNYCTRRAFVLCLCCCLAYNLAVAVVLAQDERVLHHAYLTEYRVGCPYDVHRVYSMTYVFLYAVDFVYGSLSLCTLLVFNVLVMRTLRSIRIMAELRCVRRKEEHLRRMDLIHGSNKELSILIHVISVSYVICKTPRLVLLFCWHSGLWHSSRADYAAGQLSLSSAVLNPLVYVIMRRSVLSKLKALFLRLTRYRRQLVTVAPNPETPIARLH